MRQETLAAAVAVLGVAFSACSGSSHSSAVQHPGPASSGLGGATSGTGVSWTSYHGDAEATGVQAGQVNLLPSQRAWTSPVLDGQLYGEPLVADGRVVAATENDTVY